MLELLLEDALEVLLELELLLDELEVELLVLELVDEALPPGVGCPPQLSSSVESIKTTPAANLLNILYPPVMVMATKTLSFLAETRCQEN